MHIVNDDGNGVLKISGRLEIDTANSLRDCLLDWVRRMGREADLGEVDYCDAAALQVLLAARKEASVAGNAEDTTFRFSAVSEAVAETAAALGLSHAI